MHAVVVTAFDQPPRYQEIAEPVAHGENEMLVDVLAAGLHPRVRSQADGSHYTSTDELPLIPGVDGVVRDAQGRLRYAILDDTVWGTMAERTVIDAGRSILLPDDADPVAVAAAMNPAMSSWVALRRRIDFRPGQSVLVLGATGNAGRMAVQVAKEFGAGEIVGAARDVGALQRLVKLGADRVLPLDRLADASDVDVALDYLWGEPTARAMVDIVTARRDRGRPLRWVQIGSVAGASCSVPSAALRASRLDIVGSGIGSVPGRDWLEELPELAAAILRGGFDIRAEAVPLADAGRVWAGDRGGDRRIVLVP